MEYAGTSNPILMDWHALVYVEPTVPLRVMKIGKIIDVIATKTKQERHSPADLK